MKRSLTLVSAGLLSLSAAHAQPPAASLFTTSETLNAGNISVPHLIHGDMWWNPATGTSPIEFPKGVTGQLSGVSAIWMGGRDAQSQLKVAMQAFRTKGTDFWPGPISGSTRPPSNTDQHTIDWARIWNVNRATIQAFGRTQRHSVSNTPAEILEWPGKGNIYARGAGSASITVNKEMAPFVDLNSNGIYEPLKGEYPKMKGDQMHWWVLNDAGLKTYSETNSLNVEIRVSAYAYTRESALGNIIFYEYDLENTVQNSVYDFVFATMADIDINYAFNDYSGFDSSRRLAVTYEKDGGIMATRGIAAGVVLLEQPGDTWMGYSAAGTMNTYTNGPASPDSDPQNGLEAYRIMQGFNRAGQDLTPNSRYRYLSLDMACTNMETGGDQRFVLGTAPATFQAGGRLHYAFAFLAADSAGMCPGISFSKLEATSDSAYKTYWTTPAFSLPVNPTSVGGHSLADLNIYPNPAQTLLFVNGTSGTTAALTLTNALGARLEVPQRRTANGFELNVEALPSGIYNLSIRENGAQQSVRFVKQ